MLKCIQQLFICAVLLKRCRENIKAINTGLNIICLNFDKCFPYKCHSSNSSAKSLNISLDQIVMGMIYTRFCLGLLGCLCQFVSVTNWDVSRILKSSCESVCVCLKNPHHIPTMCCAVHHEVMLRCSAYASELYQLSTGKSSVKERLGLDNSRVSRKMDIRCTVLQISLQGTTFYGGHGARRALLR